MKMMTKRSRIRARSMESKLVQKSSQKSSQDMRSLSRDTKTRNKSTIREEGL